MYYLLKKTLEKIIFFFEEVSKHNIYDRADSKGAKRQSNLHSLFALLGSVHKKSAHKMLMKSTPAEVKGATPLLSFPADSHDFVLTKKILFSTLFN